MNHSWDWSYSRDWAERERLIRDLNRHLTMHGRWFSRDMIPNASGLYLVVRLSNGVDVVTQVVRKDWHYKLRDVPITEVICWRHIVSGDEDLGRLHNTVKVVEAQHVYKAEQECDPQRG